MNDLPKTNSEYVIREISLSDDESNAEVLQLLRETFGRDLGNNKLRLNTTTRNNESLYLGAFMGNELAAFNAFIGHSFQYNSETVIAHQSCWTATSIHHRRKGLFASLINEAKVILKQKGSAFIFGAGNNVSQPILINKLGFRYIPIVKVEIPVFLAPSLAINYYTKLFSGFEYDEKNVFYPIESEIIELKQKEFGNEIRVYNKYNNIIWGKLKTKEIKGVRLKYFAVGGLTLNKPHLLPELLKDVANSENVTYMQFVANQTNTVINKFRNVNAAPYAEHLIIFDLNINTQNAKFNIFVGIKDVF